MFCIHFQASVRAAKFMGTGMVQAAGVFQYMSPLAGLPSAMGKASNPRPKASYYDDERRRHRNYSNMQYSFT